MGFRINIVGMIELVDFWIVKLIQLVWLRNIPKDIFPIHSNNLIWTFQWIFTFKLILDCVSDNKRVFFPHINSYFNYHFGLLSSDSHPESYAWIRQNWSNHHYFFHQSYIRIWFLPPWCFIRILRRTYEALRVWFNLNCLCRISWKDL